MHEAFPGLADIWAIARKTEVSEAERRDAIKAILRQWSTPSLAMFHQVLSR